jgi:hypothetical protein
MTSIFPDTVTPWLSMLICVVEMMTGVLLLLGVYRKFTSWLLLLMIVFFSFLTFYSAYFNKVTDCGCFGDAVHLTPWQSFSKDLILLVLILIIFFNQRFIRPIMKPNAGRSVAVSALVISCLFTLYAFTFLPPIDFRPYKIGNDIQKLMQVPPGAPRDSFAMTFVYEKNGQKKEFGMNDLSKIDSTWKFIERKDVLVKEGYKPPIHDFSIAGKDSELTYTFLHQPGYRLMIVQYDIQKSNTDAQPKINELTRQLMADGKVKVWALSGSSAQMNDLYIKQYNVPYPLYQADVTMLKTIIRSNPGLVLFHDNVVVKNWPSTRIPSKEDLYSYMK